MQRGQKLIDEGRLLELDAFDRLENERTPLQAALATRNLKKARSLLKAGADPNEVSEADPTPPLILALQHEAPFVAEELIELGANSNAKDKTGTRALALSMRNYYFAVARALVRAGANIDNIGAGWRAEDLLEKMRDRLREWDDEARADIDSFATVLTNARIEKAAKPARKSKKRVGL